MAVVFAWSAGGSPLASGSSSTWCSWDMSVCRGSPLASESSSTWCSWVMSALGSTLASESSSACCSWVMSAVGSVQESLPQSVVARAKLITKN